MEVTPEKKSYQEIVQKAWEDKVFKEALLKDPVAVIEEFTGKGLDLSKGKTIIVRDLSDTSIIYFDIPALPDLDDIELNHEQLEAVAGGISGSEDCSCTGDVFDIFKKK